VSLIGFLAEMHILSLNCRPFFMRQILYYIAILSGLVFLLNNSLFEQVYFKIIGLILVMFFVYKLQSKIPSKSKKEESFNTDKNDENV
jgi:hypothetical protein